MKAGAVNGSPRGNKGFTDVVVQRFLDGARDAGAETDVLYPAKMKIAPCVGCLRCWFKHPGECRHKDDMPEIMELLGSSDIIVLASPVYVDNMTGQMKTMFDRFAAYSEPFFEFEGERSYHPRTWSKQPKVATVSVCGFPEREHFDAINLTFRRICMNMRADLLGELCFPASSLIASNPGLVADQLAAVEDAGREAVESGRISADTLAAANRDYVDDPRRFDEQINEMFHELRRSFGVE